MATAHAETPGYSVTAGLGRISRWMIIQAAIGAKVTAIGLWITGRYLWTQQLGLGVADARNDSAASGGNGSTCASGEGGCCRGAYRGSCRGTTPRYTAHRLHGAAGQ